MKILFWTPRIVSSPEGIIVGGSTNAMLNLIKSVAEDLNLVLFTHTDKGSREYLQRRALGISKLEVRESNVSPNTLLYGLSFFLRAFFRIWRRQGWNADIIHGHSGFVPYALLSGLLGKALRRPAAHSLYCPVKKAWGVKALMMRVCLNVNDILVAMSQNVKNSLLELGIPEEKVWVLPQSVDLHRFSPSNYSQHERDRYGISQGEILILYVGNLKLSKGLDVLIESLAQLREIHFRFLYTLEHKDSRFESRLKKIETKITELGLSERTQQLGIIESMPALLASTDLLVIPYRDTYGPSDYPLVLLEAMASGVAAIGSEIGGIPELIEDGVSGRLIPPNSISELAQAIKGLIEDDTTRKRMASNARNISLERFLPESLQGQLKGLYNRVIEEKKG